MPKILSASQIEQFRRDGCIFPIRVMSEQAALECRDKLEAFERASGAPLRGELRHKSHLLFAWIADLVRHERILDAVEDLYGPNLLCWTTNFFIKEARNPAFVSWHQDSTYWGLDRTGSHLHDQIPHRDTFDKHNLLTRGQQVMVEVDDKKQVLIRLQPGEMSLHHVRLVHGSPPNPSGDRRIGLAIRYIPTYVRQSAGADSATLVRGVDEQHHFEHEPRPSGDLQPEFVALHKRIAERNAAILYRGTGVKSFNERQA